VRRPKPRFDNTRNAWVTRAGGKLKILAKGPNNTETEAAPWMVTLLERFAEQRKPSLEDFIFLDNRRKAWTSNAVRCRMRRLRKKLGLEPDENGEKVVAYTLRHTVATRACTSGVPERGLADLMGHTSTNTTAQYQHPQLTHLAEAINRANPGKP
jgi:integrase